MLRRKGNTTRGLGTWVKLPDPESVEILAHAGFDFVVIDLEHTTMDLRAVSAHIAIARALSVEPLVRVPDHGPSVIQRVLDAGAAGVVVPHVDNVEQATTAAQSTRFPPRGTRGSGGTSRAGRWGTLSRADYLDFGNSTALCIVQLESKEAIDNAPGILAVDGVDSVFVGTADLSMSLGIPANDKRVQDLVSDALGAAADAERPIGTAAGTSAQGSNALARGFDYVVVSNDTSILANGAREIVSTMHASDGSR